MNTGRQVAKRNNTIMTLLETYKDQIARALPRHLSVDRMVRIAMTEIRRTPQLLKADPASLFGAVIQAAQLGLEPGINGQAYLVPFRNGRTGRIEVQFIPGYKGLMDLARRSGKVKKIVARVVREGDEFEYQLGTNEFIRHIPRSGPDAKAVAAYAVAVLEDGTEQFEVMLREEIDRIRQRSKAANSGPWATDYEEMAKKTVARRLCKYLPASVELSHAVALDEVAEAGRSQRHEAILDISPADADMDEVDDVAQPASKSDNEVHSPTDETETDGDHHQPRSRTEQLKEKIKKRDPLVVLEPDGSVSSSVMSAREWVDAYRARAGSIDPDMRPSFIGMNVETLRKIAEKYPDLAKGDLEAAEAMLEQSSSQPQQIALVPEK